MITKYESQENHAEALWVPLSLCGARYQIQSLMHTNQTSSLVPSYTLSSMLAFFIVLNKSIFQVHLLSLF